MSTDGLSAGWTRANVEELGELGEQAILTGPFGASLGKDDFRETGVPVLTIGCLAGDGIDSRKLKFIDSDKAEELATYRLRQGDLLFSRMATVGRVGFVPSEMEGAIFNYHLMRLRLRDNVILKKYFYFFVRGSRSVEQYLDEVNRGATRDGINTALLSAMPVDLPPLPEQRRIVEKIETLTNRSRRAREVLDTLPALIDRYRQSILAAAFRGELTADWRNKCSEGQGELPAGWAWKTIAEIIDEGPTNGYSPKAAPDGNGTASLRLSATTSGRMILDESTIKKLVEVVPAESKFWLRGGDILIQRANSLEHLGATAIYNGTEKSFIYPDLMMRVRIAEPSLRTYFWRYMNSRSARHWLKERATGTAGNMPKISGATLKELPVPVPPPGERAVINQRIDRAFAAIDRHEQAGFETMSRLDTLDQSILAKAFQGALVPQDPNDEPASALLDRIRAERASTGPARRRGRRPRVAGVS